MFDLLNIVSAVPGIVSLGPTEHPALINLLMASVVDGHPAIDNHGVDPGRILFGVAVRRLVLYLLRIENYDVRKISLLNQAATAQAETSRRPAVSLWMASSSVSAFSSRTKRASSRVGVPKERGCGLP